MFPLSILTMAACKKQVYLKDLAKETWKYGLILFQCICENTWALPLYLTLTTQDGIVPCLSELARYCAWGDIPSAVSQVELEELESHHVMWLQHHEFLEQLELEFNLREFGYVKGDCNKFQEVQVALNRKKMEYIEQGKDNEMKKIRSLL